MVFRRPFGKSPLIENPPELEEQEDSQEEIELLDVMARDYEYEVEPPNDSDGNLESKPLIDTPTRSPRDKYYAVFFIFGFLGLASLLPWNFFITAKKYFDYKFRNTSLPGNVSFDDPDHSTHNQVLFESDLSIVSNGCNLFFSLLTVFLAKVVSVRKRIISSGVFILIIFIATTAMVKVNTDSWQDLFLIVTLGTAALMSGAQSVMTSSVLGLSAIFPFIYSQSAMIGQAAGGTFSSVVSILTHWTGGDAVSSAFIYFLIAIAVTLFAIVSYLSLHVSIFAKYHLTVQGKALEIMSNNHDSAGSSQHSLSFFWNIFKKIWLYCLSISIVFFVTLAIFPSVCSLIKAQDKDDKIWNEYFTPVVCFLLFNLGDFIGRLITFAIKIPGNRPRVILVLTILRIAFIPLLMFCNAQPRHHMPVYLEADAYPIVLILLMGLSNGYLGTLCMSFGPLVAEESEAEVAGIMLAMFMTAGLAFGSFLSALLVKLL